MDLISPPFFSLARDT